MKKIIEVEVNGSSENPEEIIRNLFKREKNVSARPVSGERVSCVYVIGGQLDSVKNFIKLLETDLRVYGMEIVSVQEVRNHNPIDMDTFKIDAVSIIPT